MSDLPCSRRLTSQAVSGALDMTDYSASEPMSLLGRNEVEFFASEFPIARMCHIVTKFASFPAADNSAGIYTR